MLSKLATIVAVVAPTSCVPYLTSHRALLTKKWAPLEPGTLDHKYYVPIRR